MIDGKCRALGVVICTAVLALTLLPLHGQDSVDLLTDLTGEQAVPTGKKVADARSRIRELFASQYADRTPEGRAKLAQKLMAAAESSSDAVVEYAMYDEARELAMGAGDAPTAIAAVNLIRERFDMGKVGYRQLKAETLTNLIRRTRDLEAIKSVLAEAMPLVANMIDDGDFGDAFRLTGVLRSVASRVKDEHVSGQLNRWQRLESNYRRTLGYMEKLEFAPDDAKANRMVGRFYCFDLDEWEKGLPMLAKSDDEALKAIADQELALPAGGDAASAAVARADVGDAWHAAAAKINGHDEAAYLKRADYWYLQAIDDLTGLRKLEVEKRLAERERDLADQILAKLSPDERKRAVRYKDKIFLYVTKKATMPQIQEWCKQKGATLASIRDAEENAFITNLIANTPSDDVAVLAGGASPKSDDNWAWSDGTAFEYQNWAPGKPDKYKGDQPWLGIHRVEGPGPKVGQWNDLSRDLPRSFVAQWKISPKK